jgi:hypothetical protein
MADFLEEKKREIDKRLKELRPWSTSTSAYRRRPRRSMAWRATLAPAL